MKTINAGSIRERRGKANNKKTRGERRNKVNDVQKCHLNALEVRRGELRGSQCIMAGP